MSGQDRQICPVTRLLIVVMKATREIHNGAECQIRRRRMHDALDYQLTERPNCADILTRSRCFLEAKAVD